jgi:hypothetical protein
MWEFISLCRRAKLPNLFEIMNYEDFWSQDYKNQEPRRYAGWLDRRFALQMTQILRMHADLFLSNQPA